MNTNTGKSQHVSRHANGLNDLRRKLLPASLFSLLGLFACGGEAWAGGAVAANATPTGGTIVGGSGAISQSGANTTIVQKSQMLALNWQSFNVGANASVLFKQPSFTSVALNRILDQNPSQIFGHVNANGQIFLINTHGIIFGAGSQMNVGGLVASTLDLTPSDFLANHFNLDAHGGSAGIVNHGTIEAASGGSVSLIGGQVANDGVILANYGHINLDGADRAVLDFDGDGLINVQVTGALQKRLNADEAAVTNKGKLQADSGTVVLQASAAKDLFTNLVNNTGVVEAGGITTRGGKVQLIAGGGNTVTSGTIDVSGSEGGSVQVLSDQNVGVTGNINASGTQGGGTIRVGGGYQGGEGLQTANATYVAPTAKLNADATQIGNGGSIVIWGDQVNNFYGTISARGGVLGGNGGLVETSSHYGLDAQGNVDASAVHGKAGTWLLDPYNVTINSGSTSTNITTSGTTYTANATGSTIGNGVINGALSNGTSVFVFTGSSGSERGDITVNAPIGATTQSGTSSLYLEAAGSILLTNSSSSNISSDGFHALNVNLWSNYGGAAAGTTYSAGTCSSCQVQLTGANITTTGGNVDIETNGAVTLANNASITTGGGNVSIGNATTGSVASLSIDSTSNIDTTTLSGGGNLAVLAGGGINAQGALTVGGTTLLSAGMGALSASNASNNFNGAVSLSNSGNNAVDISNDTNLLQLGNVAVGSSTLTVTATGITQASGTQITQASNAGIASFTAGAGVITLANTGNNFTGTVVLNNSGNHSVALSTSNALQLGNVTVGTSTLALTGVGISQASGATITQGSNAGQATFNGGAGAITLGNSSNNFTGAVGLSNSGNNAVTLSNGSHALKLGNIAVGTGTLSLAGVGVTQSSGTSITQVGPGAVTVTGGAAAVTLNNSGNDFVGAVGIINSGSTHNVQVNNGSNVLTLGAVTAGGSVSATSSGGIDLTQNIGSGNFQTYTGPVTLLGDVTLTNTGSSGAITFTSTVDGAHGLSVINANNAVSFGGAVGGSTPLASLTVTSGGGITLGGNVSTIGAQNYNDAVQLNATNTQLTGSTVTAPSGITGGGLAITGNASLAGVSSLTSLSVSGTTGLSGNVTTSSTQSYGGDVTLNGDTTLGSGGNVTFGGKVDSGSSGQSLTVNAGSNTVIFDKPVGGTSLLNALASNGSGPVVLDANVSTSGAQTYGGAVELGDNVTLSGSSVTFNSTIDNLTSTQQSLTVDAAGGLVSFNGAVGAGSNGALAALTTDSGTFSDSEAFNIGLGGLSITTTGGSITQGAGFTVAGSSSFNAGNNGITLNAGNAFAGQVSLANAGTHNVSLKNSSLLTLGAVSVGNGTLSLTGAGIQQASGATITQASGAGAATFNAGSNAITLSNANNFTGAVNLTGATTAINDSGALKLGTLSTGSLTATSTGNLNLGSGSVGGTLTASSNGGAISQTSGLSVSGASSFNAGAGSITLGANNTLGPDVSITGGTVSLNNTSATQLNVVNAGSLVITSGGAITQTPTTGVLIVTGTSGFSAGGSNITLANSANQFGSAVSLAGNTTQIASNAALTLGTLATGDLTASSGGALNLGSGSVGALTATGNGTISQGGVLTVGGAANITQNKNGGDILLDDQGNDFQSSIVFNPVAGGIGNLSFTNTAASASGLTLPTVVSGNLTLDYSNSAAQLTFPGTSIGGSLDLTAGNGISVSGNETTGGGQTYHSAVTLGGATVLTGGGPIVFDSSITGSSALTINAGTGNITLNNAGNALTGAISLNGANATLFNNAATQLGASTLTGSLVVTSTGAITQSGALSVLGTSSFDAGNQGIALINGGNAFSNVVSLKGNSTQITNAASLTLGQLSTGNLTASSSGGALNLGYGTVGGTLTATASGTINQFSQTDTSKALTVSSAVTLTDNGTGDVQLTNPGNSFGSVSISGASIGNIALTNSASGTAVLGLPTSISGNLTLDYANAPLVLPGTTVGGSLSVTANGITINGSETTGGGQTYNGALTLGGDVTLKSNGTGDIDFSSTISGGHALTLDTHGNVTLGGAATLTGLTSTSNTFSGNALTIGSGGLSITTTGGAILQTGAFTVTGSSAFNAGGNAITLTNGGNNFAGAVALTGGTTQISQGSALTLGAVRTGSLTVSSQGDLNLGSGSVSGDLAATSGGGAISEGGALSVSGNSTLNAGTNAITLTNAGNAFGGAVNLTGGATQISDTSALNLGALNTGDLTATSNGNLNLGSGNVGGNLVATSNGGAINQTGALAVAGTTALNAGNGAISLTDSGNTFTGAVTATGAGVALNDAGDLTVASLTDNANGSVALTAGGTLTAYGISAGSGDIALASNGGTLSTGGAISGGNLSLTGHNGITSTNSITASGSLTMTSANGAITSAGGLSAGTLTGSSAGATALNGTNTIGTLGTFSANGFSLSNGQSLTVTGPITGNGSTTLTVTSGDLTLNGLVSGTSTALNAAGNINQGSGGGIVASTLSGGAGGAANLSGSANQIGALGNFGASHFTLLDGPALTINGTVNGGTSTAITVSNGGLTIKGAVLGTTTTLNAAGAITENGGSITAGTLSGGAAGAATLNGSNQVGALGNFSANGFSLNDGQALTVNGSVNGNSSTALTTTSGGITINGTVIGSTVALNSAGSISEGSNGIQAGTLTGSSIGATTLNGANQIGSLGPFTANGFSLTDAQALAVNGAVSGGSSLALTTTSGGIDINSAISGTATSLNAAGALSEGAGGSITAATLSGNAGGVTTLTGANKVGTLGNFRSLSGFSFVDDQSLTLSSLNGSSYVVNAGTSPLSIAVTHGNLYQTDHTWSYDSTGSWSASGAIGTQANPIYVTGVGTQYVTLVGDPPAYFYAVDRNGNILSIIGDSVNVPTSLFSSRAQNVNNHLDSYIDASVITANYRSFGIVPSGILLPPDQQSCQTGGGTDCADE
jgi:filamentous hemagglutinin family protein